MYIMHGVLTWKTEGLGMGGRIGCSESQILQYKVLADGENNQNQSLLGMKRRSLS